MCECVREGERRERVWGACAGVCLFARVCAPANIQVGEGGANETRRSKFARP